MGIPALIAFLHHLFAFTLVATIALEFMLIRDAIDERAARRLRIIDSIYGASAGLLLVAGLLRVFFLEKGAAYSVPSAESSTGSSRRWSASCSAPR